MSERIKVNFSKTANLGNYESMKIEVGIERDLKPGENRGEAIDTEIEYLCDYVEEAVSSRKD